MSVYYQHAGITIHHGDCLDVLPDLCADVVLTDPPYGHGARKWSGGTWAASPLYDAIKEWDSEPASPEAMALVLAAAPVVIVWGGNYYNLPLSRGWLSWVKSPPMETMADFELAWTNMDRPAKAFRSNRNPDGQRAHPTQKPLELMQWCLGFAPTARTVLDPFAGSGSTLVAAKNLGRRAIGIEKDERYCEIAARRLSQEVLDLGAA